MTKLDKVIKGLKCCLSSGMNCDSCPYDDHCYCHPKSIEEGVLADALELLKEQEDEKKRIMKVIWDTLHEGLSIDTVPDQDWVYEQIRHRIEDI